MLQVFYQISALVSSFLIGFFNILNPFIIILKRFFAIFYMLLFLTIFFPYIDCFINKDAENFLRLYSLFLLFTLILRMNSPLSYSKPYCLDERLVYQNKRIRVRLILRVMRIDRTEFDTFPFRWGNLILSK